MSISSLDERFGHATLSVNRFEVETTTVTEPAPVHVIVVDALVAKHTIATRVHRNFAADRTRRTGAVRLFEVPWSSLEAVGLGGEGTDRADLGCVTRKVR